MKTKNITLFYSQEKSDKVYKASIEKVDDDFIVNFAYGRKGATLKTGTKTQTPVSYEKSLKIYNKLVTSKTAKGYVPDEDNSAYISDNNQFQTGIHCQLLNPIDESELEGYFADDNWWMQEKMDGKRMLIKKEETETTAINRKGLSVGAPEKMILSAQKNKNSFIIDGEAIDNSLFVFDMLSFDNQNLKDNTYQERYELLQNNSFSDDIILVKTAKTEEEKRTLYTELKQKNAEGLVLKNHQSKYTAGRPNSGGTQFKFKFYDTATVIVSKINDKRSVGMSLIDNDKEIFVGNVTISVNKDVPKLGSLIEVRYLYAYKGGSLYQPTFLNVRTDIDKDNCTLSQLKYKS